MHVRSWHQNCLKRWQTWRRTDPGPDRQRSLREAVFLNSKSSNMDQALARETDKIDKLRRIAQQQTYSGTLIGLTGHSRSIISLKAFHTDNIVNRTRLSFSGRISQASGQASSLVDTPATLVKSIINQHRLAAQGMLPSQIFRKAASRSQRSGKADSVGTSFQNDAITRSILCVLAMDFWVGSCLSPGTIFKCNIWNATIIATPENWIDYFRLVAGFFETFASWI